jgi:hypothetical protein
MSRTRMICLGLLWTGLSLPAAPALAQTALPAAAPAAVSRPGLGQAPYRGAAIHQRMGDRHWVRSDPGAWRGHAHRGRFGRGWLAPVGYGPWSVASGGASSHEIEIERPVDRNAFEHMPVRMGIARSPTPQPTIYRLEGRRDRPATRVIRIDDPEPRQGRRTRFAHAETGALLLVVPGR